jgi:hypothetical protein
MCRLHAPFRELLLTPEYHNLLAHLVVDEAHCIADWGPKFRDSWSAILEIRAMLNLNLPILATSATMAPHVLSVVRSSLHIAVNDSLHLNLGNNRPNITQIVVRMPKKDEYGSLGFMIPYAKRTGRLLRTIVFVRERDDAQQAARWLQNALPLSLAHLKAKVGYIHAGRWDVGRAEVMRRFAAGVIDILCATECAGMGNDIPDIDLTVMYKLPTTLSSEDQRGGRAGRAKQPARAILFVESTAYEWTTPRAKKPMPPKKGAKASIAVVEAPTAPEHTDGDDENEDGDASAEQEQVKGVDGQMVHRKKVDSDLRRYFETEDCRRVVKNNFFAGPPLPPAGTPCCDLCILETLPQKDQNFEGIMAYLDRIAPMPSAIPPRMSIAHLLDAPAPQMALPAPVPPQLPSVPLLPPRSERRGERRQDCREALECWRDETYEQQYATSRYGPAGVLPDTMLTELAANKSLRTTDHLAASPVLKGWRHVQKHGPEVLAILAEQDHRVEERKRRIAEQAELQRQREKELREAAKLRAREETTNQRKAKALALVEFNRAQREKAAALRDLPRAATLREQPQAAALREQPQALVAGPSRPRRAPRPKPYRPPTGGPEAVMQPPALPPPPGLYAHGGAPVTDRHGPQGVAHHPVPDAFASGAYAPAPGPIYAETHALHAAHTPYREAQALGADPRAQAAANAMYVDAVGPPAAARTFFQEARVPSPYAPAPAPAPYHGWAPYANDAPHFENPDSLSGLPVCRVDHGLPFCCSLRARSRSPMHLPVSRTAIRTPTHPPPCNGPHIPITNPNNCKSPSLLHCPRRASPSSALSSNTLPCSPARSSASRSLSMSRLPSAQNPLRSQSHRECGLSRQRCPAHGSTGRAD